MTNKQRGFTLLEVLVALAVFSVAAMSLMKVSESQFRVSQHLEEKTFAHWIALNVITEMQVNQDWPSIFALLGVGSYRLLASTISTRDAAKTHDNALMQLQRALTVINRDLAQTVSRPIRDEYGDSVAAVVLKMNSLELTRIGVPNPLKQVRSDLQRVNYSLNTKGELVRSKWQQLDRDRGVQAQQTVLLTKVKTISIRAHNPNGGANAEWPIVQGRADDNSCLATQH